MFTSFKSRHFFFFNVSTGEEDFSFGYGGTGKASVKCKFVDFGEKFGVGDVIGAYVVSPLLLLT